MDCKGFIPIHSSKQVTGWLQPFAVLEPNKKLERTRPSNQTKQRLEPSPKWELEPTQPTQPQTKHTVSSAAAAACFRLGNFLCQALPFRLTDARPLLVKYWTMPVSLSGTDSVIAVLVNTTSDTGYQGHFLLKFVCLYVKINHIN